MSAYRRIAGVRITEWIMVGTSVQECFQSGFKKRCRDIAIIGDCMRECIPDTRGAACAKLRCTNAVHGRGMFSRLQLPDLSDRDFNYIAR